MEFVIRVSAHPVSAAEIADLAEAVAEAVANLRAVALRDGIEVVEESEDEDDDLGDN